MTHTQYDTVITSSLGLIKLVFEIKIHMKPHASPTPERVSAERRSVC